MGAAHKIKIIVVDRTRLPFLKEGQDLYLERLSRYASIQWIEIKPTPIKKGVPPQHVLDEEAKAIYKKIKPDDYVIAMDKGGTIYTSEQFAQHLGQLMEGGRSVLFLIGGPLGIAQELLERAHEKISISSMTFTHEWCRVLLLEQIYRAFTILRGEKYHK